MSLEIAIREPVVSHVNIEVLVVWYEKGLGVQAFQVVQDDYENVTIRIVPNEGYCTETESLIRSRIQAGYGTEVDIYFKHVKEISRESSGKTRLIVGYRPTS